VKNRPRSHSFLESSVSRRTFLGQTAAAAMGLSIVPRRVLGGAGYVPPSDKVNIAFIGVGSQGLRVMLRFLREPDVQGVAVCDPNRSSANYPQWDTHEFCKSVRKLLGVDSGWDWLSPDQPLQLTHSLQVTMVCSNVPASLAAARPTATSGSCSKNTRTSMPLSCALPTTCTRPYPWRR